MGYAACTVETKDSRVKVQENGKVAIFLNPDRRPFRRTQVDGCLIKDATCCDWWVVDNVDRGVAVELKGTDVSHALKQIEATLDYLKSNSLLTQEVGALIVCRQPPRHPSFSTELQKARSRLQKQFGAPLKVASGRYECCVEELVKFAVPKKLR